MRQIGAGVFELVSGLSEQDLRDQLARLEAEGETPIYDALVLERIEAGLSDDVPGVGRVEAVRDEDQVAVEDAR